MENFVVENFLYPLYLGVCPHSATIKWDEGRKRGETPVSMPEKTVKTLETLSFDEKNVLQFPQAGSILKTTLE